LKFEQKLRELRRIQNLQTSAPLSDPHTKKAMLELEISELEDQNSALSARIQQSKTDGADDETELWS
jgi:hypothetical protein